MWRRAYEVYQHPPANIKAWRGYQSLRYEACEDNIIGAVLLVPIVSSYNSRGYWVSWKRQPLHHDISAEHEILLRIRFMM